MCFERKIKIPSFAKINWVLKVLGSRSDSFHEVRTILQSIDLADWITIKVTHSDNIQLEISGRKVAKGKNNIIWKAAELLKKRAPNGSGADIFLEKRIPVGAGLGGGSSNAAVTLLALNQVWSCGLKLTQLLELSRKLGSDVPFFLLGGTALGKGHGDFMTPLPDPPEENILLGYPGFSLSTKKAYAMGNWPRLNTTSGDLTKRRVDTKIRTFCEYAESNRRVHLLIENDFDKPLLKNFPRLAEIRWALEKSGCEAVSICGSGSTVLGVSVTSQPVMLRKDLSSTGIVEIFKVLTLSRDKYRAAFGEAGIKL